MVKATPTKPTPTKPTPTVRATLLALLLLTSAPAQADYQAGLDAYKAGDFSTAMQEWLVVAEAPPTAVTPSIYIETHYAIAMLHWQGQGVPRDYFAAYDWLLKAANMNHAGAQAKLGFLYTEGIVVEQDYARAFDWFKRAARQGDVDAQYNLGVFYLNGWGTAPDRTMAKQYLAAASAQGDEAAEEALLGLLAADGIEATVGAASAAISDPGEATAEEATVGAAAAAIALQDENWIMGRTPERYTIQVIALSNLDKLRGLVEDYADLAPFAVYRVPGERGPLHVLVQGDYPDVESARAARDAFPTRIQQRDQLWIRKFGMVQRLVEN